VNEEVEIIESVLYVINLLTPCCCIYVKLYSLLDTLLANHILLLKFNFAVHLYCTVVTDTPKRKMFMMIALALTMSHPPNGQNQILRRVMLGVHRNCWIIFAVSNFHQKTVMSGRLSFHSLISQIKLDA